MMAENVRSEQIIDRAILPIANIGGLNERSHFERAIKRRGFRGQPILVAGFIGQGGKDHLGESDMALLEKYRRAKEEIGAHYPYGVEVALIGADLHGVSNGAEDRGYLELMSREAIDRSFDWRPLSELYADKGISLPDRKQVKQTLHDREGAWYENWMNLPEEVRSSLIKQAERRSGNGEAEADAFYYFSMRKNEEQIFLPDFEDVLFVINGYHQQARHFFPNEIPQMYWVDVKDGGRKARHQTLPPPWFRND